MRIYEVNDPTLGNKTPLKVFQSHKNIGVDIDDTLIGDNYYKHVLQKFIIDYHLEKNFYLITFRLGYWVDNAFADIAEDNDDIKPKMFKGIWSVPQDLSDGYRKYRFHLKNKHMWERYDDEELAHLEELENLHKQYHEWKGQQAKKLGCTILIDDMIELVKPGCDKYGVKLIHPLEVE